MPIAAYISQVRALLHDPNAQFYSDATLTSFINEARQLIALEGECVRGVGSIPTVAGTNKYNNTAVQAPPLSQGITPSGGLIVPRSLSYNGVPLESRNWEWFNFYWLGIAQASNGPPKAWAPLQTGGNGFFYVGPTPDAIYSIGIDGVWTVNNLTTDPILDIEAIPYPWTDAVQFYSLFLAYTDSQRHQDAEDALTTYETTMQRARGIVTPLGVEKTYLGGAAARTPPGMAPPTVPERR